MFCMPWGAATIIIVNTKFTLKMTLSAAENGSVLKNTRPAFEPGLTCNIGYRPAAKL